MCPAAMWIVVGVVDAPVAGRDGARGRARRTSATEDQEAGWDERGARAVLAPEIEERLVSITQLALLSLGAGELDRAGKENGLQRREPGGGGRHGEERARAIGCAAVQQVVVNLHHDLAPRGKRDPGSLGQPAAAPARRPGRDPVRVVERVGDAGTVSCRKPGAAEARPPRPRILAVEALGGCQLARGDAEEDHVVHDLGLTGLDPGRGHERVARLFRVEEEAPVVVGHALRRRRLVGRLHAEVSSFSPARTSGPLGAAGLRAGPSTFPPARAHARIVARCSALRIRASCPT